MRDTDLYTLREGQPVDYQALRSAFVIACDSERLAEAVRRDMRVSPYVTTGPDDDLTWLQDVVTYEREWYESHKGVSVIIPLHNYGRFVADALDSLMAQTRLPSEVIVVDDASTDDSADVVQAFIDAHDTGLIELVRLPRNVDVSAARNIGIRLATQEHIVCLDADDMIEPRYIETLHDAMLADLSLGVAYSGVVTLNQTTGERRMLYAGWPPEFNWDRLTTVADPPYNCIPTASMFRREMWRRAGGYQQTYRAGEDIDFWVRGLSTGFEARKVTAEPLFVYRRHGPSMSTTRRFSRIDHFKPWMRDRLFPFASPSKQPLAVPDFQRPVVSVVIPVGPGHAQVLPSALESVIGQTSRAWEVIVVNDTGAGFPPVLLESYPFARVVDGGARGASHARNVGVQAARGAFVLFLDADDWLMPDALHAMLQAYAVGNAAYVYTDWHQVDEGGKSEVRPSGEYDRRAMLHGMLHPVTILIARDDFLVAGGFDESLTGYEDWEFMAKLAHQARCGARVPRPLLAYRVHTGTQRNIGLSRKDERASLIRERYGDMDMAKRCCGGNGNALLQAKAALGSYTPPAGAMPAQEDGKVTMEYIGTYAAPVTFLGKYAGAQTPLHKFANVDPNDVERLARTGHWRRATIVPSLDHAPQPQPRGIEQMDAEVAAKIERAEQIEPLETVSIPFVQDVDLKEQPEATLTVGSTTADSEGDSPNYVSTEALALRARNHERVNNPRKRSGGAK